MREFATPTTVEIPTIGNLSDDVVRNGAEAPEAVVFNRPAAAGGWEEVTAAGFLEEVRGKIGPLVFRRFRVKIVVQRAPDMSRVRVSPAQAVQRARFHSPCTRSWWACGMLRACASSSAMACSAALTTFDCGAFTTITPRAVAAATRAATPTGSAPSEFPSR